MKTTTHETIRPLVTLLFALTMVALSTTSSLAFAAAEMPYDPCWDAECGPCEVCEAGECFATPGASECQRDEDCGLGFLCEGADSCAGECVEASEEVLLCQASGGAWDDCGFTPFTACSDCAPACVCPAGMRMDGEQCVDCEGGECSNPQSFDALCVGTGGDNQCRSACAAGEMCAAVCMMVCVCPDGLYWDGVQGCIEAPEVGERCADTGGVLGCEPIDCPADQPECEIFAVCVDRCDCPAGQAYDPLCGCVDVPVVIEEPIFEGCSQSGMGPIGLFGCSGGGSGRPDLALLLGVALALAVVRRRALLS